MACGLSSEAQRGEIYHLWLAIALVEASFHVNNFVLFYVAAVVEKRVRTLSDKDGEREAKATRELTSVTMRPALIEGFESGVLFTLMIWRPAWTEALCWLMAGLVGVGICQRTAWVVSALS